MKPDPIDALICRVTSAVSSNAGLAVVAAGMLYWMGDAALRRDWVAVTDALLSGGALLIGLMIYREAAPRDEAMHEKLDTLIHGVPDADDAVAGIER